MRDRLLAGIPNDPKLVEGWLFAKGVKDEEDRRQFALRTLRELGHAIPETATYEEAFGLMESLAELQTSVFKRNERGIYLESRQVDAMLKETVSVIYSNRAFDLGRKYKSGEKRDQAVTKLFRSAFIERVTVDTQRIHLMRDGEPLMKADGVETRVGHVMSPEGPRSVMHRNEYVDQAEFEFDIAVLGDFLSQRDWAEIWTHSERHGLGAARSQDYGRFDVTAWDKRA
jgi:hypothetical protein